MELTIETRMVFEATAMLDVGMVTVMQSEMELVLTAMKMELILSTSWILEMNLGSNGK